jgi:hypothetical protein
LPNQLYSVIRWGEGWISRKIGRFPNKQTARGRLMRRRRRLRKTIPFLLAIFFGTMACALVAGVALLAAHP